MAVSERSDSPLGGPDQLLDGPCDLWTSDAWGHVKIRDHDQQSLQNEPPVSVPSLLRKTAECFPDHQVRDPFFCPHRTRL